MIFRDINVKQISVMGSDLTVVNAARVSMDKESLWNLEHVGFRLEAKLHARDAKLINGAVNDLALITGQKPDIRKARKSIGDQELALLQHLSEHGEASVGEVAAAFGEPRGLARSTVSRWLAAN